MERDRETKKLKIKIKDTGLLGFDLEFNLELVCLFAEKYLFNLKCHKCL